MVLYPHWDAAVLFLGLTGLTICAGHSVGMHRLLIHRSFETPKWLEHLLVWLGVLVGLAGPVGMIIKHDMCDWHQRQSVCPAHPAHGAGFWCDTRCQLCCRFALWAPPVIEIEAEVLHDPVYRVMERFWRWQNVLLAGVLFALGGWPYVLWAVCLRVFVSLVGLWMVGHFAHRDGQQSWRIARLPVQGYDLRGLGWVTFGENWHGNHHAFPHSARLGIEPGQADPGFLFIRVLAALGLARNIKLPGDAEPRSGLTRVRGQPFSGGEVYPNRDMV